MIRMTETLTQMTIRPFADTDYPTVNAVSVAAYPDYPWSEEEFRHWDSHFDGARLKLGRLVAEDRDGRTVGFADWHHSTDSYHPQKFFLDVTVHPDEQRRGIGPRLYDALITALALYDPIVLWGNVKETFAHSIRFAEQRGFVEKRRAWESRLQVAAFDPSPFEAKAAHAVEGLAITTAAAAAKRNPAWQADLHDLHKEVLADVPRVDEHTPPTLEEYIARHLGNPGYMPEAHFLVQDGDRFVAESDLFRSQELPSVLYQGITGTRRAYRNRGLALALKLRTVAFARANGIREIRTWNDSLNAAMLHINTAMGFVRQTAWISLEKVLPVRAAR